MSLVLESSKHNPKLKQPVQNFIGFVKTGNFSEILRAVRRRLINLFGPVYNSPAAQRRREQKLLRQILSKYFNYPTTNTNSKIKIVIIARDSTTYPKSSAFIRLISPLTNSVLSDKVSFSLFPENTVQLPPDIAACIVQRTAYDNEAYAEQLFNNLQAAGVPLVVDTDDAFNVIDPVHPEHAEQSERIAALDYLISKADRVWLSVPKLKTHLPKPKGAMVIMRNSLDSRLWQPAEPKPQLNPESTAPLQLLYMGTVTHDADLAMILPALKSLANKTPGSFVLSVVGVSSDLPDEPWIKRLYQQSSAIYPNFVNWYLKQGPFDVGLSPLVDNEFNRCKSDIKCLDYLAAEIMPLVSDAEPYKPHELSPYIIRVSNNREAWQKKLEELVMNAGDLRRQKMEVMAKAQQYLWQERSVDTTAKKILEELRSLKILD